MRNRRAIGIVVFGVAVSCIPRPKGVETNPAGKTQQAPREEFDDKISDSKDLFDRVPEVAVTLGFLRPRVRSRRPARSGGLLRRNGLR
jgi:hypothetical protein